MMVAQEIAGLLGETTAETKTTLTKLCKSLLDDGTPDLGFTGGEEDASRPNVHLGSAPAPQAAPQPEEEQHTGYVSLGKAPVRPQNSYVHFTPGSGPKGSGR